MATPDLVQTNVGAYTLSSSNLTMGFPLSPATFRYALFSFWVCLGQDGVSRNITWQCEYNFFKIFINSATSTIRVSFTSGVSSYWFDGTYNHSFVGPITNIQISVDGVGAIVRVYANDAALTLASGGVGGSPPGAFQMTTTWSAFNLTGGTANSATAGPGIGDLYMAAPAAFYDLTVTANRRKFQNADLSPVDLGTNAISVLGTVPPIYLTARGGNAANFAVNNGMGGSFSFHSGYTPTMLAPGSCTVPWSTVQHLAMDDVVVTATLTQRPRNLISLRWSDDRGHSFGHPVSQAIGDAGEYRTSLQWQRLAYARDRVFEIYWDVPMRTALQGAWIDVTPAQS